MSILSSFFRTSTDSKNEEKKIPQKTEKNTIINSADLENSIISMTNESEDGDTHKSVINTAKLINPNILDKEKSEEINKSMAIKKTYKVRVNYKKYCAHFLEAGKFIKMLNSKKTIFHLKKVLTYINEAIEELKHENYFYLINIEIINSLNNFLDFDKDIKSELNKGVILNLLNDILLIIYNRQSHYKFISKFSLLFQNISLTLHIIYLNEKTSINFLLLNRLLENYMNYIENNSSLGNTEKDIVKEFRKSYPNYFYIEYNNIEKIFYIKGKLIDDKQLIIEKLKELFNSQNLYIDKFELLPIVNEKVLKFLIDDFQNEETKKIYLNLGNFLLKFLLEEDYIFEKYYFKKEDAIPQFNYLVINKDENCYDLSELPDLANKKYKIKANYEFIKSYEKDICNIINKFLEKVINNNLMNDNFEFQFMLYLLIKKEYFIFPEERKYINKYIPNVLENINNFKEEKEWNKSLEVREFGYYLLSQDRILSPLIKITTSAPKDMPNYKAVKLLINNININLGYFNKIVIPPKKKHDITIRTYINKSIIYFEFNIEDKLCIDLRIYKAQDNKGEYKLFSCVNNIKSINEEETKKQNIRIIIVTEEEINDKYTFYKLSFDNTDSLFKQKCIYYNYAILEPK